MAHVQIASLIFETQRRGLDLSAFKAMADANRSGVNHPVLPANDVGAHQIDLARFDARNRWSDIPVREWLLGHVALRSFYTLITSPGGRGKTALAIMMAGGAVMGRSDLCGMQVRGRLRVVFISGEDSGQEMMRRVRAFCQEHGVSAADLGDRLLVVGAREIAGLTLNRIDPVTKQVAIDPVGFAILEQLTKEQRADLVICDPLVSFFPAGLNDNAPASAAMGGISGICERQRCAIILVHHVSKGAVRGGEEASALAALGAVSISSHARAAFALMPLSEKEAPSVGVHPSDAKNHFQLVNTKANLARASNSALFQLKSVTLPNADPAKGYPVGDMVQVAMPVQVGSTSTLYGTAVLRTVLVRLATGAPGGMAFSPAKNSVDRDYRPAIAQDLAVSFPDQTIAQREVTAAAAVAEVLKRGWAEVQNVKRPRVPGGAKGGSTPAKGLVVRWDLSPFSNDPVPGPHAFGVARSGAAVCSGQSYD
jgi:hypothetical protein